MKYFQLRSTRKKRRFFLLILAPLFLGISCNTLEKASVHGLTSGYYRMDSGKESRKVYVDVSGEKIDIYDVKGLINGNHLMAPIPIFNSDSLLIRPLKLKKQSLDIDITTILLKYRPSISGLPRQLTNELNMALYAGWRHDNFRIRSSSDPLGRAYRKSNNLGYDFGIFAGPGTTPVNPFSTNGRTGNDYSGMILQTGIAAFIESNIASFGVAIGADQLMNRDRKIWIYHKKPWVGFVVGIALN